MKKQLLLAFLTLSVLISNAQVVPVTVSLGAGYANQKWYSLQNGEAGTAAKTNWDLAFDCSGFGYAVLINSVTGTALWNYPNNDSTGWATVDTTGISTWEQRWNSDTTWIEGALNSNLSADPFDVGWGIYNSISHIITGDSIFIIKLSTGDYKKMMIQQLLSGTYSFKYANLDGSNSQNATLAKSAFNGKNFGYFSLQTNATVDREPLSDNWDLLFTQYTGFVPSPYTVSGVLSNKGVTVADVRNVANTTTYADWSANAFTTPMNEIGYDWKYFSGSSWTLLDSTVFFVKAKTNDIWKIVFTDFGGSANGNFTFNKELITSVGIKDESGRTTSSFAVYPNPSNGKNATVIYSVEKTSQQSELNIYDFLGRRVYSEQLNSIAGLHAQNLNSLNLKPGIYFITMTVGGERVQQQFVVNE